MLMYHKNFRFTQIPDKTNDMIFLVVLVPMFQKIRLCHTLLYMGP